MDVLLTNTIKLINISSLSFSILNIYILYNNIAFDLSSNIFMNGISLLILLAFIVSTLLLLKKMVLFSKSVTIVKVNNNFGLFLFYLILTVYCLILFSLRKENLYFNINIYSIIFLIFFSCLTHFLISKPFFRIGAK